MKFITTFNQLKLSGACGQEVGCGRGYDKLSRFLSGADNYGKDKEINILTILESNGLNDALWCFRAIITDDEKAADRIKRLIAADFAESVLRIFESKRPDDDRPRKTIEAARKFANSEITVDDLVIARRAAAAAYAAAADAAAADAAAYAAAAYAADADAAAAYAAAAAAYAAAAYAAAAAADDAADAAAAAAYAAAAYAAAADARKDKKEQLAEIVKKYLEY